MRILVFGVLLHLSNKSNMNHRIVCIRSLLNDQHPARTSWRSLDVAEDGKHDHDMVDMSYVHQIKDVPKVAAGKGQCGG